MIAGGEILYYNIMDQQKKHVGTAALGGPVRRHPLNELDLLPIPLLQWYEENKRQLPWRSDPTPYKVLVSEVMLQQTRVAAVLGYFARFMAELPTVRDLAAVDEDRLMKLWQGLGYYNRARNLQKAARQIVEDYGGEFPGSYEALLDLAGVGEYTAGAVASIAFGIPVPAVDGNVLRVVARITADDGDILKPDTKRRMRDKLQAVLPRAHAGDFNQAMMELGATVCLPNGAPQCRRCPAADFCAARLRGLMDRLPVKAPKKGRRVEERTVFLIFRDKKVALRRRPDKGLLAGLWEYPNGPAPCPCPVEAKSLSEVGAAKHIFTHIEWHMTGVAVEAGDAALPDGWVWAGREELRTVYAVPNAFQGFQPIVEERLSGEA